MKRKITQNLLKWKLDGASQPYMLVGARQVGKTYSIDGFCRDSYTDYIYLNLEKEVGIRQIFEKSIDPDEIVFQISMALGRAIDVEDTVIFFDEIQVSEKAITALKYFCESEKAYHIITAGSLLGVALNRFESSFPVGKIRKEYMYPMDFEEFLWGVGEELVCEEIKKCYTSRKALFEPVHEKLMRLYKDYLYVGGMPASILEYKSKQKNIMLYDRIIKRNILEGYIADMSKYTTTNESMKIKKVYLSIPKQLGRENNKFSYKLVEDGARKLYYETSIEWLIHSQLLNRCMMVELPQIPLIAYEKSSFFKVYLNDVGLLAELADMSPYDVHSSESNLFKGMLTENYVAQSMTANDIRLYYWRSSNSAEIDFIISIKGHVIPVEVKAALNTKSKSLMTYRDKYNPEYVIKVSGKNFGFVNEVWSIPLYAVHLIGRIDHG